MLELDVCDCGQLRKDRGKTELQARMGFGALYKCNTQGGLPQKLLAEDRMTF